MARISVCIATYNGGAYIREQLVSIFSQLGPDDEVVVSDDGSGDSTLDVCNEVSLGFPGVSVIFLEGPRQGLIRNFENSLRHASGDYIFLSDQDDVWLDGKVEKTLLALKSFDLVVTNCKVVDSDLLVLNGSFFDGRSSGSGFVKNCIKNSYLGCCMAFNRDVLDVALPFPEKVGMHDWWIGLVSEAFGKRVVFIDEPQVLYRRHGGNASDTAEKSKSSFLQKVEWRIDILKLIFIRRFLRR